MKKRMFIVAGFTFALISGCATQSIQQGKDLSTSGIAYTNAVESLLDVTTDRVIDFDTDELKKSRRGTNPMTMITQKNKALEDIIIEISKFRSQTKLLKAYFLNLQALADSPVKDDTGVAVKSLSDSISNLNKALSGKVNLTEDQKTQTGALAGLVANTIHAAKVKNALVRDAEIVGTYLALQEDQLKDIEGILSDRFNAKNDLFLNEKVIGPYVNISQPLTTNWDVDRKQWFMTQFISQQLSTAQEAAKQLRGVWADILQGKSDINSLSVLISDVNEFVVTAQALKAAGQ
ncbi:hypothetical protein [Flavobacterium sp.]|uniref:hypothetical protein n=1 Tax=Flavobacterium sp. TaxID=239 RepID=UPI0025C4DFAE|nr:hypothetical protein [Flavobacterium sp.]